MLAHSPSNANKGIPIVQGSYVVVKVSGTQIEDKGKLIIVLGTLEKLASDKEIKEIIEMSEKDSKDYIDIDSYINSEKKIELEPELESELESTQANITETEESEESEESNEDS